MKEWFFHVRHGARPSIVKEIIRIAHDHDCLTIEDILDEGSRQGYEVGTRLISGQSVKENPIQVARDLGFLEEDSFKLADLGCQMYNLMLAKPKLVSDLFHFFYYSAWHPDHPSVQCPSWTYLTLCDKLWQEHNTMLDKPTYAGYLIEHVGETFHRNAMALSTNSINGILNWLRDLDPSVINETKKGRQQELYFSRRDFCAPELFLLAVDHCYKRSGIEYQSNLLLDPECEQMICKICLLNPSYFRSVLEWTCERYEFIHQNTGAGWGQYLVLSRPPTFNDFIG